jgi:DNA anti-recombination protein RmuC
MDFQCETEGSVTKAEEGLENAYKTLTDQVSSLKGENTNIIKGFEKVRQQVKSSIKGYNNTDEQIKKHIKETPTLNRLLMDSEKLETLFSMRNTGYVLLLILLSIFLVRVLRK